MFESSVGCWVSDHFFVGDICDMLGSFGWYGTSMVTLSVWVFATLSRVFVLPRFLALVIAAFTMFLLYFLVSSIVLGSVSLFYC